MRAALLVLCCVVLGVSTGCNPRPAAPGTAPDVAIAVAVEVQDVAADSATTLQEAVTANVTPAVLAVQQIVQEALPPSAPQRGPVTTPVSPAAVALIVREEIISPAYFTKALQGFACPGKRSGPTVGIGGDLGVHTPARIRDDWSIHPRVDALALGSGVIGFAPCRAYRLQHMDVRTPFELAQEVFATKQLPAYYNLAAQTFRNGWDSLPPNARGAITATVYVRGAGMRDAPGSNMREEMRVMRDVCVPAGDAQCVARQHLAMCQRFSSRPPKEAAGLCKRFTATAELAVQA